MGESLLGRIVAAAENVLLEGLSEDQLLDYAEDYSRLVQSFVESGMDIPDSQASLVLSLHQDVLRVVAVASGRSGGLGHRRSAVKAYLAALGPRFGEGRPE